MIDVNNLTTGVTDYISDCYNHDYKDYTDCIRCLSCAGTNADGKIICCKEIKKAEN
jgi:hypothetical protein